MSCMCVSLCGCVSNNEKVCARLSIPKHNLFHLFRFFLLFKNSKRNQNFKQKDFESKIVMSITISIHIEYIE